MRKVDFDVARIEEIERAVAAASRLLPPASLAMIRDLFMVMKTERSAIKANKGELSRIWTYRRNYLAQWRH